MFVKSWSELHKPVVVYAESWKNSKEKLLFYSHLKKMLRITNNEDIQNNHYSEPSSNKGKYSVISVVGERGAGKTSVLESYRNILNSDKYYVLDVVNPDLFESKISLLIIFVTQLNKILEINSEEMKNDTNYYNVIDKLRSVTKILLDIQREESYYEGGVPTLDFLTTLDKRLNFKNLLKDVVEGVLSLLNYKSSRCSKYEKFIIVVDDIDLSSSDVIYQLFDEVNKYLSKVADIVLSYRESQLINAITDKLVNDQKRLLKEGVVDISEIQKQAVRIIDKLIPQNNKVYLYSKQEILYLPISEVDNTLEKYGIKWRLNNTEMTITEAMYIELFLRTNLDMRPIDGKEDVGLFFPII